MENMKKTPESLRLHIGIFGRTNVGKSSFLNLVAGQDAAITSPVPGTTTDVVQKTMELLPIGPVVLFDTAGVDDQSMLSDKRAEKTERVFHRADIAVLVVEPGIWGDDEERLLRILRDEKIPVIIAVNKSDLKKMGTDTYFLQKIGVCPHFFLSCTVPAEREQAISTFKKLLLESMPPEFLAPPPLIGDLLPPGGLAVMVVPIDLEAPKGRLIMPQVQAIRDILDNDAAVLVVKEREYRAMLERLVEPPQLAVCDSQVVLKMVADTPAAVKCTTFSILFSRARGDLIHAVIGVTALDSLRPGDRVLIAEACSHHAIEDDIARVKIPRWLRQYLGFDPVIDYSAGSDYPRNLAEYRLVIHCGGCMINRREMLSRINRAREAGVPITNYGVTISYVQGVLSRVLSPFPAALDALQRHAQRGTAQ